MGHGSTPLADAWNIPYMGPHHWRMPGIFSTWVHIIGGGLEYSLHGSTPLAEAWNIVCGLSSRAQVPFPGAEWPFYVALGLFRAAAIFAGVHARATQGNASNRRAPEYGPMVAVLAQ
eukprot:7263384-Pyramimonas_sp.AAC.1